MTSAQSAAFIAAQTQMMRAEEQIMLAENEDRFRRGFAPANGPDQWLEFRDKWEPVLGYNAILQLYSDSH